MKIKYFEEDGKIHFEFKEERKFLSCLRDFESSGEVPRKIEKQGERAVREYVEGIVRKDIAKQENVFRKIDTLSNKSNFPVSVRYQGAELRGKITGVQNDRTLCVELDEPYQGLKFVHFGWASAVSGRYIFTDEGDFSKAALEAAKRLLIEAYEQKVHEEKHKETIDLAKRLNQE